MPPVSCQPAYSTNSKKGSRQLAQGMSPRAPVEAFKSSQASTSGARAKDEKSVNSNPCVSDAWIVSRLRTHFRNALRSAKCDRKRVYLELYAGAKVVTAALRKDGCGVIAFEIDDGPEFDLTRACVHRTILGWIRGGCVAAVFLGTQCSSWSRARRGPPGTGWCAIRSNACILGLPGLLDRDRAKIEIGNLQVKYTCHIIRTCVTLSVPCMLENPLTSMMWLHPLLISLCRKDCAEAHVFDQCQFGAPWKKATKIVSWHCGHELFLTKKCSGHKGICSRSHKPHIVLSGCSKQHGVLWTSLAQKYPPVLSKHIARKIIDQSTHLQLQQCFGSGQKP